ncbi:uncharacterized protein LOC106095863 [Stomoxys calcitrans]|uniref:uncharacterized protein LOC106095863 n=1 Tax=Stomoxys calcitrans TaxID=35570 RepID=UPI0027E3AFB6|nr:uncharacterized protein LOC106095863 [Stomoxys calcitrans]
MANVKKIALGLIAIYIAIVVVDGDIVKTTMDPLVGSNEVTTISDNDNDWSQQTGESSGEVTTPGNAECVCSCIDQEQECLTPEECTAMSNEETTTTADVSVEDTTTMSSIVDTTTLPLPPLPPTCAIPGVQPDVADCRAYHVCSSAGFSDGLPHLVTKFCSENEAFSVRFGRCSREISSCFANDFCIVKGGLPDPMSNTSYYLCEPRLVGGGFHIFHVKCSPHQIFYPELGKCFIDMANLPQQPISVFPPFTWNILEDIDVVKAELKLIKEQDKLKLKMEKELLKAEKKRQKELEKEAEQRAKEEEKLNKALAKQESLTFVCTTEGNFISSVSDRFYYACINKKGKFKVEAMQCPVGSKFNATTGLCTIDTLQVADKADSLSVEDDDGKEE